jgi:tetratricopeptide (TPR) repeat protein
MINIIRIIVGLIFILGGLGSIIFGIYPVIGSVLVMLAAIGSAFSYLSAESQNEERDFLIEAQATLFAQHGLGNIYTQAFKKELARTGSVNKGTRLLEKALDVNPNDVDALAYLAFSLSLHLSHLKWVGRKIDSPELSKKFVFAETLAQRGLRLDPKNHVFFDVLGILLDTQGKHEKARLQFGKSSRLRNDPYWRLLMATSWHMSGEHYKALHELQISEKQGAKGWLFEFYYGRAFNAVGNNIKAIDYLKSARNKRGRRPELLNELFLSYHMSGRFFVAAKYAFLTAMAVMPIYPWSGVHTLLKPMRCLAIGLACLISKACWRVTKHISFVRYWQLKYLPPDEPEFTLGNMFVEKGNYKAAEEQFRLSCKILPNKVESHANLAACLALQGRKDEALVECDRAIKLNPEDEMLRFSREQIATGNIKRIVNQKGLVVRNV